MTIQQVVPLFAQGIAIAEGFYVDGSRAQRNHNPGNLTEDTTGNGVDKDGMFIVYGSDADGWAALYRQVELILTNTSHIYNVDMTLREIAEHYTTTDQLAWATNVAETLGISIDVPVSTLITTTATTVGFGIMIVIALLWYFTKER